MWHLPASNKAQIRNFDELHSGMSGCPAADRSVAARRGSRKMLPQENRELRTTDPFDEQPSPNPSVLAVADS
jgi:hypothetical protein